MTAIKSNPEQWGSEVLVYSGTTQGLGKLSKMDLTYTDLAPFLKLNKAIGDLNQSIKAFKSYTSKQVFNMQAVVDNKVKDDAAGASNFRGGGGGM